MLSLCNSCSVFDFNLSVSLPEKPSLTSQTSLAAPSTIICSEIHTYSSAALKSVVIDPLCLCPVSSLNCGIRRALFLPPPTPKTVPNMAHKTPPDLVRVCLFNLFYYNFSTQGGPRTSSMDVTGKCRLLDRTPDLMNQT